MKNNTLGKVQLTESKIPTSRFNKPYDVNTTASWGDLQPIVCKYMIPGEKATCSVESLTRLAPMVAPTFGRVQLKTFHQFVPILDVCRRFDSLMNQSKYNGGTVSSLPSKIPQIPLSILSAFCLVGCKITAYNVDNESDGQNHLKLYNALPDSDPQGYPAEAANFRDRVCSMLDYKSSGTGRAHTKFSAYSGPTFNPFMLLGPNTLDIGVGSNYATIINREDGVPATEYFGPLDDISLPIANVGSRSFLNIPIEYVSEDKRITRQLAGADFETVSIEGADLLVTRRLMYHTGYQSDGAYVQADNVCFAIRLSSFGKRLRKQLLGCGYQIDLNDNTLVSVLPLFATWKAYYDFFGLTRYQNYEDQSLAQLIAVLDSENFSDLLHVVTTTSSVPTRARLGFFDFIYDLANMWFTEDVDFISAHQSELNSAVGVTQSNMSLNDNFELLDAKLNPVISKPSFAQNGSLNDGVVDVTSGCFSHLDVETLKRLYLWSNNQSVVGRSIAESLRAQGFEVWVAEHKTNFIGKSSDNVQISAVVSQADTYKDGEGAFLGEYSGFGSQYTNGDTLSYETDCFGFWIGFLTVVPQGGYTQGIDPSLLAIDKFKNYNPQFDGIGYEMSKKNIVATPLGVSDDQEPVKTDSFGLIPRYSGFKVSKNIANGDFSLRGRRNSYLPYSLDKVIPLNEVFPVTIKDDITTWSGSEFILYKLFDKSLLPTAGDIWRFLARYPWLGWFDRIFKESSDMNFIRNILGSVVSPEDNSVQFLENSYDNILVHNIVNFTSFAPMLPIEETFGTKDDDKQFNAGSYKA